MMHAPTAAADLLGELPPQTSGHRDIRPLAGILIAVLVIGLAVQEWVVANRSDSILAAAGHRAAVILESRAETLGGWLTNWRDVSEPVRNNQVFRLLATELKQRGARDPALLEQLPYMQAALDDFVRQTGLDAAYLISGEGNAILAATGSPSLSGSQRDAARAMFPAADDRVLPLRLAADGRLMMDVAMPMRPVQARSQDAALTTEGVLLITLPATSLADVLAPGKTLEANERLYLIQSADGGAMWLDADDGTLKPAQPAATAETAFDQRESVVGSAEIYASLLAVAGTPWQIIYERTAADVRGPIVTTRIIAIVLVVLLSGIVSALVLALWWRQSMQSSQAMTDQYRTLAGRINAQRRMITSINDAITEHIAVADAQGRAIYVNKAFRDSAGLTGDAGPGSVLANLLPRAVAEAATPWDNRVLAGETVVEGVIEDYGPDGARWLAVSKVPLLDDAGLPSGIITVARDITAQKQQQERKDRLIMATVRTLSRSVAAVDSYLADHSARMESIAVAIAREMGATDEEIQTLETAAHLSQVGKIFLPRDLISKSARLTAEERHELERHIELALDVLKDVEFGLPIPETIAQMYERLDGSGYPCQLAGDQIGRLGRILGVADVFAARTKERSYRGGASAHSVLEILRTNGHKYDSDVVQALERALARNGP